MVRENADNPEGGGHKQTAR